MAGQIGTANPLIRAHTFTITARIVATIGDENAPSQRSRPLEQGAAPCKDGNASDNPYLFRTGCGSSLTISAPGRQSFRPGVQKDEMLRKARQADTACHLEEWVNSSGLQAPK